MDQSPSAFSRFLALFNPVRAIRDFREVWMQENPYRWRFLAVSAAVTFSIFSVMFQENYRIEPRPPEITYIESFEPGRTDAEIIASNIENQRRKESTQAQEAADRAEIRRRYEVMGQVFGMDIEDARREGEKLRAQEAREQEELRQRALDRVGESVGD